MKVRHDLLHPRPTGKAVRVAGRDPRDEPNRGRAGCVPVVRGIADEEGLFGCGTGLGEDLPDAFGLRLRRAVDPDEVLREIPATGDLQHLALWGRGDDIERERARAVSEEFFCATDIRDGEHGVDDQVDVLAREPLLLLGGERFLKDVCVDVAELVVPGHPAVLEVEGDDLVEVFWGREGEDLFERRGLQGDGFDDDTVEVEDEGGEGVRWCCIIHVHGIRSSSVVVY